MWVCDPSVPLVHLKWSFWAVRHASLNHQGVLLCVGSGQRAAAGCGQHGKQGVLHWETFTVRGRKLKSRRKDGEAEEGLVILGKLTICVTWQLCCTDCAFSSFDPQHLASKTSVGMFIISISVFLLWLKSLFLLFHFKDGSSGNWDARIQPCLANNYLATASVQRTLQPEWEEWTVLWRSISILILLTRSWGAETLNEWPKVAEGNWW